MLFSRGMRDKIAKYADPNSEMTIDMSIAGGSVYDFTCFGVDSSDKLSDDRYMIFYNQTSSPQGEIRYQAGNNTARFVLRLSSLPQNIAKLVFTASIDGDGVMGDITQHKFVLSQNGTEKITIDLKGSDFNREKAIITAEIYRKNEWRINAIASGFNGGLSVLLKKYGGEEEISAGSAPAGYLNTAANQVNSFNTGTPYSAPSPAVNFNSAHGYSNSVNGNAAQGYSNPVNANSAQGYSNSVSGNAAPAHSPKMNINVAPVPGQFTNSNTGYSASAQTSRSGGVVLKKNEEQLKNELMGKISLSKDKVNLEKHVVSLSKTVVSLSKKSGVDLGSMRAKVVVALDFSGSMNSLYKNGTVQTTINKLVPLGLTFDDNGSIDLYLFHHEYMKMEDLNLRNYENYITSIVMNSGYRMGGTNYAPVLKAIIEGDVKSTGGFFGIGARTTYVNPIVDNGDPTFILFITDGANADRGETNNIIKRSSSMNVFIQFIGIGYEQFDYLRQLDDMQGRARDNTGFSRMESLENVSDEVLYNNVLEQFSMWLRGMQ